MLIGRFRLGQAARLEVDVEMALARPVDAIGPMQPGVEPLRGIRRGHLPGEHEAHLVEEGARILLGREIAALPPPIGPGASEPVEDLLAGTLRAEALTLGEGLERVFIGNRPPEPGGNVILLDALERPRHTGAAEIFLRQHIASDLAPRVWNLDGVHVEDDRAVRIADFARRFAERNVRVRRLSGLREATFHPHDMPHLFGHNNPLRREALLIRDCRCLTPRLRPLIDLPAGTPREI